MIKLISKNLFFCATIMLIVLICENISAQELNHRLGILSIQLNEDIHINEVVEDLEYFEKIKTEIQVAKLVSVPFNIWNVKFNHNKINEVDFLYFVRRSSKIVNAQFDFFIENRSEPDDPWYFLQYHLKNNGQNGGIAGVDLDAELAWDNTTGGVSFFGDTIVLCIIDEDFDVQHNDLYGNTWINHSEIPEDSIDNDENGYVDDYYGWNVVSLDDNVDNGGSPNMHGTKVTGIAGAIGNNNLGIAGVNWNVKLMYVSRGYTFSDAVAAYTYPYLARKKYNDSNGLQGAFVVATNSSWGVDYGTPDQAPLWCAIYDSLGSVGVLSAAATANLNIDVDEVGDLPTTCQSNFLVTTTKVDQNDEVPSNAGYGAENIDLAAFGKDIFTTNINNQYGLLSGTSAAAPQIAGAISLMYAAPCPSFISLARNQPEEASLLIKDLIFLGVEPNANLQGITLTGGRLNVANSLQLLMDNCNFTGCYPPYSISIENISDQSVTIDWLIGITTTTVDIRYRALGELDWIELNNLTNPYEFSDLSSCTTYEFQLASSCGTLTSDYSLSYQFQTAGCCDPPLGFEVVNVEENQVLLVWNEVESASLYRVRYREANAPTWNVLYLNNDAVTIPGLYPCTDYEFQIQSLCNGQASVYSESIFASTLGCSNCLELPYCDLAASEMSFVGIKQVSISNLNNISQNSIDGYSDHTNLSADLILGQSYEISLLSESDLEPFPAIFNVWIDFNQDGLFDDFNEWILHSSSPETSKSAFIYIPTSAYTGSTRMRVSFMEANTSSCGSQNYLGEVEDYCVNIEEPTECLPPTNISLVTSENTVSISWFGNLFTQSYLIKYREVIDSVWTYIESPTEQVFIDNLNECTDYKFQIHSVCNGEPGNSTEEYYFTTKGCGTCLDFDYCPIDTANASFEWIHSLKLGSIDNTSGPNNGYAHFYEHTTNLIIGNDYQLEIIPGFSSNQYEEYYMVWLDLDHDGQFGFNEIIYDSNGPTNGSIQTLITIPDNASILGSTRMRVIMKYQTPPSSSCDFDFYGEIEEYCINVVDNESSVCDIPENFAIDSVENYSASLSWEALNGAVSYMLRYRPIDVLNSWKQVYTNDNGCNLLDLEACTEYQIQVRAICELGLGSFSNLETFNTSCESVSNQETNAIFNVFSLFPNPAFENFFVEFQANTFSGIQFELFDVAGKKYFNKNFTAIPGANQFEFHFPEGTSDGVYYLKATPNGQKPTVLKVIKID